jgi:hypothetical protein
MSNLDVRLEDGQTATVAPSGGGVALGVQIVTGESFRLTDTTKNWVVGFQELTTTETFTLVSDAFLGQLVTLCDLDGSAAANLFVQSPADGSTVLCYRTTGGSSYSLAPTNRADPLDAGRFFWGITPYGSSTWQWNGVVWSLEAWTPRAGLTPP